MSVFSIRCALVLVVLSGVMPAAISEVSTRIPPGYTPEKAADERGLWMELADFEKATRRSALLIDDDDLSRYVREAACRVAGEYCKDLRIYVIRNPGFNALMTANGMMQIWTGLLVRVTSEDELAAVVGHELAHYTQLHTLDQLRRVKASMAAGSILDLGLAVLGVPIPAGQLSAVVDAMAFSREQEHEADLIGVQFMAEAGYDPNASYRVWRMVVTEERDAVAKRKEPGMFSRTHPDSENRADMLERYVNSNYSNYSNDTQRLGARARHVDVLSRHYMMLMEDQIDTNRFGRTRSILERHRRIGVETGLIDFFYGEMYRQRGDDGDSEKAKKAYAQSISSGHAPPEAYRNLGYLSLKDRDLEDAKLNFNHYLRLKPDASDRAMIEFYLQES